MAWAPSTDFEEDFVNSQPGFNFIQGQWAYEAQRKQEFDPRPKSTYEYLAKRDKRNKEIENQENSRSKELRSSLAMMEYIQDIAGTRPLGEHATMADWDDTSNVEKEALAMVRTFGMLSVDECLPTAPRKEYLPKGKIHTAQNGRRTFPLILDPEYFQPGRTRKSNNTSATSSSSRRSNAVNMANNLSGDSLYGSAKSHLDETKSDDYSFQEIPYEPLKESPPQSSERVKHIKKNNLRRPTQTERRKMASSKTYHL